MAASSFHRSPVLVKDPPVELIHPDWHNFWGKSIQIAGLRQAIVANPRFKNRLSRVIATAVTQGVALDDSDISESALSEYNAYFSFPTTALVRAGLIWNTASLALMVSGESLRKLEKHGVHKKDIVFALSHKDLAYPTPSSFSEEALATSALESGVRIAVRWAATLPAALNVRILMTLPHIANDPNAQADIKAREIMAVVLGGLPASSDQMVQAS